MAIEGSLKELGLQDVLQLLELARKTGVLEVRSELLGDQATVQFERGLIVAAARRRSHRRLGQQLLRAGKLTERELKRAQELQHASPGTAFGDILLEMGSISEEELERHLRFQVEETIFDVMSWDEGRFRFEEGPEGVARARVRVRVRVDSLLMEGARRIDEWSQLEAKVPGLECVPALAQLDEATAGPLDLHPEEWEVLAEIDGERDLRQLAGDLGRATFDIAKTVYGLLSTGVVQVLERPGRMPERELEAGAREVEALLQAGRAADALEIASGLESAHPERADVALLVGRALADQGRMRAATEAFARAVSLDPLLAEAQYRLGYTAVRTGDLARAAQAWDSYLRLVPAARNGPVPAALAAIRTLERLSPEATE
jgi:tetratricopeptide (TPR) repeat protein